VTRDKNRIPAARPGRVQQSEHLRLFACARFWTAVFSERMRTIANAHFCWTGLWCNRILFKIVTNYNNCIIVKSHKMNRMTIVERTRAVGMLVSSLSLRQLLLTLSHCLSCFQYFIISYEVCNMDDFSVLFWKLNVTITDNKHTRRVFGTRRRTRSCATTKGEDRCILKKRINQSCQRQGKRMELIDS
jgi:hypothetical protein